MDSLEITAVVNFSFFSGLGIKLRQMLEPRGSPEPYYVLTHEHGSEGLQWEIHSFLSPCRPALCPEEQAFLYDFSPYSIKSGGCYFFIISIL